MRKRLLRISNDFKRSTVYYPCCCCCALTAFSPNYSHFTAFLGCFEISVLLSTVLLSCSFYIFPESHFSSLQFAALCSKNVQRHFTAMLHTLFYRFKILLVHCSELPRCFQISVLFQEYTEVVLSAMQLKIECNSNHPLA